MNACTKGTLVAAMLRRGVTHGLAELVVAAMEDAARELAPQSADTVEEIEDVMMRHAGHALDVAAGEKTKR